MFQGMNPQQATMLQHPQPTSDASTSELQRLVEMQQQQQQQNVRFQTQAPFPHQHPSQTRPSAPTGHPVHPSQFSARERELMERLKQQQQQQLSPNSNALLKQLLNTNKTASGLPPSLVSGGSAAASIGDVRPPSRSLSETTEVGYK